ncbi:leucine-rich repeat extensin-like protein 4 [Iris pallida]|uniref:Leucine-rich repeat extensin-like protein 4 n=1 Tax=Iris pallida TaxID=29817 RepID=A0AAX6DQ46_IRIPA|nr:leucine-rich repeat extensin-like protein 4 [Iris pallida]
MTTSSQHQNTTASTTIHHHHPPSPNSVTQLPALVPPHSDLSTLSDLDRSGEMSQCHAHRPPSALAGLHHRNPPDLCLRSTTSCQPQRRRPHEPTYQIIAPHQAIPGTIWKMKVL